MKITSCGVIVHYDNYILGCVPFGQKNGLDIPKGQSEQIETGLQTAVRELYEETGIRASRRDLKDLGTFKYLPGKDLNLFSYKYNFDISKCKCSSYFDYNGKSVPEIVGYKKVDFSEIHFYYKSLQPILKKVIEEL